VATYHVDIERDESGAWIAIVAGVPGAHTYGRSLRQVRQRVREALSLWVDDDDTSDLQFEVHLPRGARAAVRRASSARSATTKAAITSAAATNEAATFLVHDCKANAVLLKAPARPWRMEISVSPTFVPHEVDPTRSDTRHLGGVLDAGFQPLFGSTG